MIPDFTHAIIFNNNPLIRVRLMENILCYLSNAVKYSSSGTISVSCSLGQRIIDCNDNQGDLSSRNEVFLRISVEDEGIGVNEEVAKTLFKPFQQTMRLAGGTGLGLYSLSKRIEALKGGYGVSSRSDGKPGSQFWFSIPYLPDESFEPMVAQTERVSATSTAVVNFESQLTNDIKEGNHERELNPNIMKILIVEDTPAVANATKRMLTSAGCQVDCAVNGAKGLDMMKAKQYDVVLMDLQMPVMDGLECARRYRQFESEESKKTYWNRPALVIIGVSANDYEGIEEDVLDHGMNAFISKPLSLKEFLEIEQVSSIKVRLSVKAFTVPAI